MRASCLMFAAALLAMAGCGVPVTVTGDKKLIEEADFRCHVDDHNLIASVYRPVGLASVTVRIKMWKDGLLLNNPPDGDLRPAAVQAGVGRKEGRLVNEPIIDGTTRIDVELVSVTRAREGVPP
jgi:hypothetical protein